MQAQIYRQIHRVPGHGSKADEALEKPQKLLVASVEQLLSQAGNGVTWEQKQAICCCHTWSKNMPQGKPRDRIL